MQYGYFDDKRKEYVITRPDTPTSWSNYLGSTEYGAIITNHAGGYGFYQSGAKGRFLRLRFNSVPMDQPGRYFYLRENQTGDFWSASWQPVGKPLEQYSSICRHGTAYTIIESQYAGIATETTYFVPLGECFEYWKLKITNRSDRERNLSVFSFCEFTNQWDTTQDQVNLQYSLFIVKGELTDDGLLRVAIQDNLSTGSDTLYQHDIARHAWMGLRVLPSPGMTPAARHSSVRIGAIITRKPSSGVLAATAMHTGIMHVAAFMRRSHNCSQGKAGNCWFCWNSGDAHGIGKRKMAQFAPIENGIELEKLKAAWHGRLAG